jgi:hypothetical protein
LFAKVGRPKGGTRDEPQWITGESGRGSGE